MAQTSNLTELEKLEPSDVWRLFAGIAAVPRPSKHEERIRAHVRGLLEKQGLTFHEDATGNIVASVPASAGCEGAPITVLQSHLDMVCEKNAGTDHDFDRDGIHLVLDTDPAGQRILRADGTTLGADNGIGAAMALAVAFSSEVKHGPLELLFTIDEEDGMTGAKALTPGSFRGRCLVNLDSEEDNALYIGCAGGCDTTLTWTLPSNPLGGDAQPLSVTVSGLRGGHSGCDIHEDRGSAIKLLARTLQLAGDPDLRLVFLEGGSKRNAIPREARAVVCDSSGLLDRLSAAAQRVADDGKRESAEPDLMINVANDSESGACPALSAQETVRILSTLSALPHGVLGMHRSVPGLVQTSNNVATVRVAADGGSTILAEVGTLSRSSSASCLSVTTEAIAAIGRLAGASIATGNEYPGWAPNVDSPILATCRRVYENLFDASPEIAAIHAGLECGIIGERVGDMDMVSFGPRIEGAHSPDERVYVASVQKSWKYLLAVLDALSAA